VLCRVVLVLVAAASLASAADYTIVRRTVVDDGGTTEQTEYWSHKRLVIDDPAQRSIVDFAAGTLTIADKEERTYSAVPLERLRRQLLVVGAVVDNLPSAAREMLGLGRRVTLSPNGNVTRIADHDAKEYGIGGDGVRGWVWLAEDVDPVAILGDEAASWWRAGGPLRAIGPLADVAQAISEGKLKGMPVWAWLTAGSESGTVTVSSDVVSIRQGAAPPDVARVPADYAKRPSPLEP
jgi:hypothetical protein